MITNLSWSALILAALAAVAYWSPEDPEPQPACTEGRPVFGATACCERHKAASAANFEFTTVAELESARKPQVGPPALP
jgi:hypothetical protein